MTKISYEILKGLLLPFLGTSIGALGVFFLRGEFNDRLKKALSGFAAGVMIAASVWSLLIPALENEAAKKLAFFSFLPATIGLWVGVGFLLVIDKFIPEPDIGSPFLEFKENKMLFLSVTLHNLPEGMAVGVVYAVLLTEQSLQSLSGAFALSLGIAIQNIPEGAIISMPLSSGGMRKWKAFLYGILSGIIEPIGGAVTLIALSLVVPILPFLLGFAAGAMIYAVLKELSPMISEDRKSNIGILMFSAGFSFMMMLDVTLG